MKKQRLDEEMLFYMRLIGKQKLITREEEVSLARRVRDEGDRDAAERLARANLRFVVKVALEYERFGFSLIDLVQEGNLGLMKAIERFDPERGNRLITYAAWWIRSKIHSYLIQNWNIVRMGSSRLQRNIFYRVLSSGRDAMGESSSETVERISGELGTSSERVRQIFSLVRYKESSLDEEIGEDGKLKWVDRIEGDMGDQEEGVVGRSYDEHLLGKLFEAIDSLKDREKVIVRERFLREPTSTLQQVGDKLGISKERVRQLEGVILTRLRRRLSEDAEVRRYGIA